METRGLWVNMKKTKAMCHGRDVDVLKDTARFPSGMCRHGGEPLLRLLTLDTQGLQWTQAKNLQKTPHTGEVCVEAWPDLLTYTPLS